MSYNKANFKRISEEYMTKNLRAKEDAERRKKVLHARFPEIAGIDNELAMTGLKLMQAAKGDPATLHERIDELKSFLPAAISCSQRACRRITAMYTMNAPIAWIRV